MVLPVRSLIQLGSGRLRLRATANSFLVFSVLWLQKHEGGERRAKQCG